MNQFRLWPFARSPAITRYSTLILIDADNKMKMRWEEAVHLILSLCLCVECSGVGEEEEPMVRLFSDILPTPLSAACLRPYQTFCPPPAAYPPLANLTNWMSLESTVPLL